MWHVLQLDLETKRTGQSGGRQAKSEDIVESQKGSNRDNSQGCLNGMKCCRYTRDAMVAACFPLPEKTVLVFLISLDTSVLYFN